MKVRELIAQLENLDQEAEVYHLWDGGLRTTIELCYMGKNGDCVTADYGAISYDDSGRPAKAPSAKYAPCWMTPQSGRTC